MIDKTGVLTQDVNALATTNIKKTGVLTQNLGTTNGGGGDNNYFGGYTHLTKAEVLFQRFKTDSELIELFGVKSNTPITVNQSSVDYATLGDYPVVFSFGTGQSLNLTLSVVPLLTFTTQKLQTYTKTIFNSSNFLTMYPSVLDFSNFTVNLNGASTPLITGNFYEWKNKPSSDLEKVTIDFTNLTTLSDGRSINCRVEFINKKVYSYIDTFQKWGFDIQGGQLIFYQSGFINLEALFEFTDENSDVIYLNVATRADNVHYAKHVGASQNCEFFVSEDTLLKGDLYTFEDTNNTIFLASRFEGDGDVLGADNIALGIVKQDTSDLTISLGKDYTGNVNFDYATTNYLDLPINMRVASANASQPLDSIYRTNQNSIPIATDSFQVIFTLPAGIFKENIKYQIFANAKYTRSAGNTNPSLVGVRIVQGANFIIDDKISIERDATNQISLSIPQVVNKFEFNATQTVLVEIYVPLGEPAVTISDANIRFVETNEVDL